MRGSLTQMDIKNLEKILATYKISKPKITNSEAEDKSLPFMLTTFRELLKDGIPPTQEDFINTFKGKYPEVNFRGIVSRLKKAYLSYVREYHLGFILEKYFADVRYDEQVDLLGVDYIIVYNNNIFNIHAFVNTKNGRYWRRVKNYRHNFTGEHIDLPINLGKGKKVGKFIFYTDGHVKRLRKKMDKIILDNEHKTTS